MFLDSKKELTPILYNGIPVKLLDAQLHGCNSLAFEIHWHERMEILYVISGEMTVLFGDEKLVFKKGELAIIPPAQLHMGYTEQSTVRYYTLMFELPVFENAVPRVAELFLAAQEQKISFRHKTADKESVAAVEKIIGEIHHPDEATPLAISGAVYELCGRIWRVCAAQSAPEPAADRQFADVIDYINKHCCGEISCTALARRFGYDSAYFSRKFKSQTGLPPAEYIKILRLERSRKLLSERCSVTQAAAQCGIFDPGYFARCFKKHFQMTPSRYAEDCRNHPRG